MAQQTDTLARPIIIADDDDDDLELMPMALQNFLVEPWPVLKGNSGKALLPLLEDEALFPVLLLIDMQMPNLGGAGLLDLLKGIERFATVPKVLISGDRNNLQAAFSAGANCFLLQTYNPGRVCSGSA